MVGQTISEMHKAVEAAAVQDLQLVRQERQELVLLDKAVTVELPTTLPQTRQAAVVVVNLLLVQTLHPGKAAMAELD